jgi:hypothetical protein
MQHDLTDGVQYLVNEKIADPKRVRSLADPTGICHPCRVAFTGLYAAGVSCETLEYHHALRPSPLLGADEEDVRTVGDIEIDE